MRNWLFRLAGMWIMLPLAIFGGLIVVWYCARSEDAANRATPFQVLKAIPWLFNAPDQPAAANSILVNPVSAAIESFGRVLKCCFVSSIIGLILGLVFGRLNVVSRLFMPTMEFIRGLPITFLLAPLILVVGLMEPHVPWMLASIPCTAIIIVQVSDAIRSIDGDRLCTSNAFFGKNHWMLIRRLYIPQVSAGFMMGLRLIVPYSVILVGVLEYVGAGSIAPGFGTLVQRIEGIGSREDAAIAAVIVYGLFGLALVTITEGVKSHLLRWQRS